MGLMTGSYIQFVISLTLVAIMSAVALVLLVGLAHMITLAAGAMMALGAYGVTLLMVYADVPFLLGVVAATALGAIGGFILGVPATRFRGHHLAMVTMVFQFVVIIVIRQWASLTGGTEGIRVPAVTILGVPFTSDTQFLLLMGGVTGVVALFVAVLAQGHFGKALRAMAATEVGAEAFGINIAGYQVMAFVISSALIALAGALQAPQVRILDPDAYGILPAIFMLAYPIVGGMTSVWGGILGGGLLRTMPEVLRPVAEYQELVYSGLVILVVVFFPGGVMEMLSRLWRLVLSARPAPPLGRDESAAPIGAASAVPDRPPPAPATPRIRDITTGPAAPALEVVDLAKSYGSLRAVQNVNMTVPDGVIHGLIGPNGAGKTTFFNMISGFTQSDAGSIEIFGARMNDKAARERIAHGVTRTFQHVAVYGPLSCLDNVILGIGHNGVVSSLWQSMDEVLRGSASRERHERALRALESVGLGEFARQPAGSLSLGNQRRVEIARAIVSRPRMILLDEPVSGVGAEEEERLRDLLRDLNRSLGITMFLIEHNIRFVVELCETLSVMSAGQIIAEGAPREVIEAPAVRRVYFGEATAAS